MTRPHHHDGGPLDDSGNDDAVPDWINDYVNAITDNEIAARFQAAVAAAESAPDPNRSNAP